MGCSDAVAVPGQRKPLWRQRKVAYIQRLTHEDDPDVLLVSACGKLHNARSIVADLRGVGAAVWDRFRRNDPAAQLWYYQTLANSYQGESRQPWLTPSTKLSARCDPWQRDNLYPTRPRRPIGRGSPSLGQCRVPTGLGMPILRTQL
jgi:hypothetical protein